MNPTGGSPAQPVPTRGFGFDTSIMHPARRYDYWLGGKDNFKADRASGNAIAARFPGVRTAAIENRNLGRRVVGWAARDGITQFLDIGTGIPTPSNNTHDIAQAIHPDARVVYVDNDPVVLAHARALLTSHTPRGRVAYLDADIGDPAAILAAPEFTDTIDLRRPVAVLLFAVLHFLPDDNHVRDILTTLTAPLPPGSILAVSHATYDYMPTSTRKALHTELAQHPEQHGTPTPRIREQLSDLYTATSLTPVAPGLVPTIRWRPELEPHPRDGVTDADASIYAYVARRP
ncbi:SAM-dependent methyltransferase [Actinoplanes sp. NBRC 103695]|uniref:SAM-dependent methyltransferase n=1 Tax=Actinoplanes sp. NBRC 103695 TaxID=3032202 RepID=UPI0024A222DC|nr:SAM-dependent methyltransferase [Actinoplanes sp. NBRC 103695]GLZ00666.1 hypothetical protein Acsp02_79180 [Actinoplanes sp. NBRC 103695]